MQIGSVKFLVPRATLEVWDIDSYTIQEEAEATLDQDMKELKGEPKVHLMAIVVRAQRMDIIEMDEQGVNKLLETTFIKIDWINCMIRRRILVPQCFTCLGYRHHAMQFKGTDTRDD